MYVSFYGIDILVTDFDGNFNQNLVALSVITLQLTWNSPYISSGKKLKGVCGASVIVGLRNVSFKFSYKITGGCRYAVSILHFDNLSQSDILFTWSKAKWPEPVKEKNNITTSLIAFQLKLIAKMNVAYISC